MKKFLILTLVLCLAALPVLAETVAPDAVTSASVADYYASGMLTGDDLMNAINSYTGFYAVASVNPDGTPNIGFYIYGCVKVEDKYYLQLGLAPNQTTANWRPSTCSRTMPAGSPGRRKIPALQSGPCSPLRSATPRIRAG